MSPGHNMLGFQLLHCLLKACGTPSRYFEVVVPSKTSQSLLTATSTVVPLAFNITPSSLDSASVLPLSVLLFLFGFVSQQSNNDNCFYSSAPTDTCLSGDSQKHCFLLHLARIYIYEIFNIYVEIKLILGLQVNRINIFNLCGDYTLYFAKCELDLSAVFHPGTGPGRQWYSYATADNTNDKWHSQIVQLPISAKRKVLLTFKQRENVEINTTWHENTEVLAKLLKVYVVATWDVLELSYNRIHILDETVIYWIKESSNSIIYTLIISWFHQVVELRGDVVGLLSTLLHN